MTRDARTARACVRRALLALTGAATVAFALSSCGDDVNDAPGGSAPPTEPAASTTPPGSEPGAGELSPESDDEAPTGADDADDADAGTQP